MFPEDFDPWMLVGVPIFWVYMGALALREAYERFITRSLPPK